MTKFIELESVHQKKHLVNINDISLVQEYEDGTLIYMRRAEGDKRTRFVYTNMPFRRVVALINGDN